MDEQRKKNGAPICITLYGADDEPIKTYERYTLPWGILKRALRFAKTAGNLDDVSEDLIDEMGGVVCQVFGEQFTLQELEAGADAGEILSVFQQIVSRARSLVPESSSTDPTNPA